MKPTLLTAHMRYWRIAPDARLRDLVQCYWIVEEAASSRLSSSVRDDLALMIPDGHSEIVFNRGAMDYLRWRLDAPAQRHRMQESYLIGGRAHSVSTHSPQPVKLAGVKLDPRFLGAIINTPLDEFRDSPITLRELGSHDLLGLADRLAEAADPRQIVALLDTFLLAGLRRVRVADTAADGLLRTIHRDRGATPIMRWMRQANVDSRRLERQFRAATGVTPKQYARVIRFKSAYHSLIVDSDHQRPLSARLDGFYDQSHFNREFRFFTGLAPTARLRGSGAHAMNITDHLLRGEAHLQSAAAGLRNGSAARQRLQ